MRAFRFFDPWAALEDSGSHPTPAKAANPAKPDSPAPKALAALAGLAGLPADIANPIAWSETEEQRAAIIEHEGGMPRTWAAGFARLEPDRPPGDVPPRLWERFVDDVGLFLDRWAAHAAALGWTPHDLFGCDRDRPFARIDQSGLLWLLNGNKLVALSEHAAGIETRTGQRLTYRCKPSEPGRVLAWELAS